MFAKRLAALTAVLLLPAFVIADTREQINRFYDLEAKLDLALGDPRKLLDPAERDKVREAALPLLRDMRSVLNDILSNPRYGGLAQCRLVDVTAMLHLLGDEAAVSWLTEGLKDDSTVRHDAQGVKLCLDFAAAKDDAERDKVLDVYFQQCRMFRQRHEMAGVAQFMLSITPPGPTEDQILDTIRKTLSSSTAGEVALRYEAPRKLRTATGKPLNLRGSTVDGKPIQSSDFKGKVVLVHFFATFNQPSLDEVRKITRLQVLNKAKGLEVLSVSSDSAKADLTLWMEKNKRITWPVVFDEFTAESSQQWHPWTLQVGISKLPTTLLIDRKGVLRYANPENLDDKVKELLAEP
jgi:peroxiredoxin